MNPIFVIDLDGDVTDTDIENVLQPDAFEVVVRVTDPNDATMEALAARAGAFASRGQARKNGFSGSVPHGLEMFGAGGRNFHVWNPKPPATPPTLGKKRRMTRQWFAFLLTMRAGGTTGSWSEPDMDACRVEWAQRRAEGSWSEPFHQES